jgi:hypothetical protein
MIIIKPAVRSPEPGKWNPPHFLMAPLLRAELIAAKQMPKTGPLFTFKTIPAQAAESNAQRSMRTL